MKRSLVSLVFILAVAGLFAQEGQVPAKKFGPFLTNKFFDNWFIQAGVGTQIYFGEYDNMAPLKDRLSTSFDLGLGKWFTPFVGGRFQYAGINATGVGNTHHIATTSPFVDLDGTVYDATNYRTETFKVANLHLDMLVNLSNRLAGYKENRVYQLIPFVGVAYVHAYKSGVDFEYHSIGLSSGFINKFYLGKSIDLNLEIRTVLFSQISDGLEGGRWGEGIGSATLGFAYKFNKRGFDEPEAPIVPDYSPYTNKIGELEKMLSDKDAKAKQLASDLETEKNKGPKIIKETEVIIPAVTVIFQIGKYEISEREMLNLQNAAAALKKATGKVYTIMGIADKQTGSTKRNQYLSEMRAKKVYDALVNKFGVDPSILKLDPKGATYQPYGKAYLNRVAIIEN